MSNHSEPVEGKPYTELEHNWDEGFGYFGAARDYFSYTDDELASKGGRPDYQGAHDTNGDGELDLTAEFNWGHSLNAAKRDRGASTDLSAEAYTAFYQGRALITQSEGPLSEVQLEELRGYRDVAVTAWEDAISATVIHYINDVIADMERGETGEDYNFSDHAKHWSEMKGFALSFQFNPRSPLDDAELIRLHQLFGVAPSLPGADDFETYREGLLEARGLLADAYGFTAGDVEGW